jgi:hypothetical protein
MPMGPLSPLFSLGQSALQKLPAVRSCRARVGRCKRSVHLAVSRMCFASLHVKDAPLRQGGKTHQIENQERSFDKRQAQLGTRDEAFESGLATGQIGREPSDDHTALMTGAMRELLSTVGERPFWRRSSECARDPFSVYSHTTSELYRPAEARVRGETKDACD